MTVFKKNDFLFKDIISLKGIGKKLSQYLKKKKIEKINDLLWNLPYSYTDRGEIITLDKLEIGKISSINIKVKKYNFPRIRNLPNRVSCVDSTGNIDLVFFNSREGYIRKVLPIGAEVVVSGKINFFRNKYQITNPDYISDLSKSNYIKKIIPKYSLTEGLKEKTYRRIIETLLNELPDKTEWYDSSFLKKMKFPDWKTSVNKLHSPIDEKKLTSNYYRRLAYDEIFAHLLVMSKNRKKIKKIKKNSKIFKKKIKEKIVNSLPFKLTKSQQKVINEIEIDLQSKNKMFRILQGDVGSGKTIVSLIGVANVVESGYQCAFMAPTSILAIQHYELARKIFKNINIKIALLTGKTDYKQKKEILKDLENNKIDLVIGTHSLFQKKIIFKKLGFIIVDEQHKFGVKQRMDLAKKGGIDCDILLMSATPIPRTMMLAVYGDMEISKITEKPLNRKKIITLSKPEEKINELMPLIKKEIKNLNQVFWVCPLIDDSKILNYSSTASKSKYLEKYFPGKIGIIHGSMEKENKESVLSSFLENKIEILVSTTVIEVGIDFPNANLIIIENANKFGLAQLHQLRGRVGRGSKQSICILLFKGSLSQKAIKRIKILKKTDDGFVIAEEDMRLRGFGDIIGFQQSGIKYFKIADPVHHADLFKLAEENVFNAQTDLLNTDRYDFLLKLFDRAEVIN